MTYLSVCGVTNDGLPCVSGAFRLKDTCGIPIEIVYLTLRERNIVIAWDCYIEDALEAGWNLKTIKADILCCVGDDQEERVNLNVVWSYLKET